MPTKNKNAKRFGGPGSSKQDRKHPEKSVPSVETQDGMPTSGRSSKISGGGGERDKHHSHDPNQKS